MQIRMGNAIATKRVIYASITSSAQVEKFQLKWKIRVDVQTNQWRAYWQSSLTHLVVSERALCNDFIHTRDT